MLILHQLSWIALMAMGFLLYTSAIRVYPGGREVEEEIKKESAGREIEEEIKKELCSDGQARLFSPDGSIRGIILSVSIKIEVKENVHTCGSNTCGKIKIHPGASFEMFVNSTKDASSSCLFRPTLVTTKEIIININTPDGSLPNNDDAYSVKCWEDTDLVSCSQNIFRVQESIMSVIVSSSYFTKTIVFGIKRSCEVVTKRKGCNSNQVSENGVCRDACEKSDRNSCPQNSECITISPLDRKGVCKCKAGYRGDGLTCVSGLCHWNEWNSCGVERRVTCGRSTRRRNRKTIGCSNVGQSRSEVGSCQMSECPALCKWREWTPCDDRYRTCGGISTRTRKREDNGWCSNRGERSSESEDCKLPECPLVCSWSDYGSYGRCSVSCGRGSKKKTRRCNCQDQSRCGNSADDTITTNCNEGECTRPKQNNKEVCISVTTRVVTIIKTETTRDAWIWHPIKIIAGVKVVITKQVGEFGIAWNGGQTTCVKPQSYDAVCAEIRFNPIEYYATLQMNLLKMKIEVVTDVKMIVETWNYGKDIKIYYEHTFKRKFSSQRTVIYPTKAQLKQINKFRTDVYVVLEEQDRKWSSSLEMELKRIKTRMISSGWKERTLK